MKKSLLILAFTLTALSGWSQALNIQGFVRDLSQVGIANQAVYIDANANGAVIDTVYTDAMGFYSITYPSFIGTQGFVVVTTNCSPATRDSLTGPYSPGNMTVFVNFTCGGSNAGFGWLGGSVHPMAAGDTVDISLYAIRGGTVLFENMISFWDSLSLNYINYGFYTAPGNYLVKAELRASSVNAGNYQATYFGQTTLPAQATPVTVQTGIFTPNISITMLPVITPVFYVSGIVNGFTPAASMDTLRVILIEVSNNSWTPVDTFYTADSAQNGAITYWFQAPNAGNYSILATLLTGNAANYLPTYYGDVSTWNAASQITVNPTTPILSANISLLASSGAGGSGGSRIGGSIFPGLPFVSTGGIAGIQVQLMDAQDNVLLATHSRTDGSYELGNLPFGTYKVRVEHFGLTSAVSTVTLDANNPNADGVNFSINGNSVSTSVEEAQFSVHAVYPNPARDEVQLLLLAKEGQERTITLRDLQGRVVSTLTVQLQGGEQNIRFPLDGIAPGMYMLAVDGRKPSLHKLIVQ